MTREAIEIPRRVNYRETMTPERVLKALGKAVCGYWNGHTMQNLLVKAGLAEWRNDRGIEPTEKGRKVFFDMTVGGGEQYVFVQTGPHPIQTPRDQKKEVGLCAAFGFGCPGEDCGTCNHAAN